MATKQITTSPEMQIVLRNMVNICDEHRNAYMMPEHMLLSLLQDPTLCEALIIFDADIKGMKSQLISYIDSQEKRPEDVPDFVPGESYQMKKMIETALTMVVSAGRDMLHIHHMVNAISALPESLAASLLDEVMRDNKGDFLSRLIQSDRNLQNAASGQLGINQTGSPFAANDDYEDSFCDDEIPQNGDALSTYASYVNGDQRMLRPLVGRDAEIEEMMRVLCRKDKNNVLLVGEPGVGKTALVYGLAGRLNSSFSLPVQLKLGHIYRIDIPDLLAGTQFRGDFEKRLKEVLNEAMETPCPIIYFDEIHQIVGAGAIGEGATDAANILKPYLESGDIRFIGATTYDEYKRYLAKSKSLLRRFRKIDVEEPSVDDTIAILHQLKKEYEEHHNVTYTDEAIEFAAKASARHIHDRRLPDKAIDLIDEAGAMLSLHPNPRKKRQRVDKTLVSEVLAKLCHVASLAEKADDADSLEKLQPHMLAQIFGQDEAVSQVVEAVQMSKAGLADERKPLASLLFVGPTGVGKTEVARVLAKELGVELVRFDMSEYAEKHTVAKLIGSPAGYVGYDDGGLLTDAIRKNPSCVLLLDEIEKAHSDIYNILLQVMDYATLSDNKGQKANFSNVVLIMTSNAGARFASQAKVGFGSRTTTGDAMMRQVKKTFAPEFLNRLSGTVVFNDLSFEMASRILDKKLDDLRKMLLSKNVKLRLNAGAKKHILEKGFTPEYGARELERVIGRELKPLLMREILFGALKNGGTASISLSDEDALKLNVISPFPKP